MTARLMVVCFLVGWWGLVPAPLFSQVVPVPAGTITGTVFGPNRDPLPRATAYLLDPAGVDVARALTDSRGRFRFDGLAEARYTLAVELVGFETVRQSVEPGTELELTLELAPVREQVVVTATRTQAPSGQLGANTTVLTEEVIANRQAVPLSDLLRSAVGVAVVRSGGHGTITSLFVRGGESDHNKVLLDGVPLNEPGGAFNFANLSLENIERVEVVRGPQSALFGSDAVASVVQLFTRRGRAETPKPNFFAAFEGGNRDTWRGRGGLTGQAGRFDYSAQWARFSTDNREPSNFFHNTTLSGNFGLTLNQRTSLRAVLHGELGRVGTPGVTALGELDRDAYTRRRQGAGSLTLRNQTTNFWDQRLTYGFSQTRRVSRDLIMDPPFTPSFEGRTAPFSFFDFPSDRLDNLRRHHATYQSDWRAGSLGHRAGQHILTFAFEWEGERGFFTNRLGFDPAVNARRDNFGWVIQQQALWGRFSLTNGVRVEDNETFGTKLLPRSSLAYFLRRGGSALGATKLKFNFGLGIKEPTLIDLFNPSPFSPGNPNLLPERTRSFDAGVEQRFWYDRGKLELNLFHNRFKDLIVFAFTDPTTFTGTFFNVGRAKAKGAEVVLELAPRSGLRGRGSYTFLDSQITEQGAVFDPVFEVGRPLLRRPKHSGSLELFWNWRRLTLNSTTLFVGRRPDSDFAFLGFTSNRGYTRWDLAGSYRTTYGITYFGVVENLLNDDYMEALGFPALKLMFRAGARVEF